MDENTILLYQTFFFFDSSFNRVFGVKSYTLENRNGSWGIEQLRKAFWGRGTVLGCGVTVSLMLCVSAYTYI